ncbi:hypothetical protein E3N88_03895 [Mikania micrantha]|uniref:Pentacotripeptide-repeat region of PRORP domain-containing protein n=1 Tax=Mikania micrantha TaxID=192012 RepID=A0A5N6PU56_9ASTR|nr:hypothetical protein E3N88_03895 [Mikania micrantha]
MAFPQIIKRSTKTLDVLHSSIHTSSSSPSISVSVCSDKTINSSQSSIHTKPTSHNSHSLLHLHPRYFCNKIIENPVEFDIQLTAEAEKLCKIISNLRDRSKLESLLDSTQVEISPALVTEVLKKLSNAGVFALSFFRWAEKQSGFKHNSDSYNALIEALGKIKQFKMIWTLVNEMKFKGVLDKTTFALISRRYARAKKVKEAMETFERMETFGFKIELCDINRFLDTLCKSRQVESAHQVFDKMTKRKFMPNIKSYTILLEGWGQEMNLLKLDEVYREMKGNGFEPDVVAYGIIINAYCKAKKYDQAIKKFDEMKLNNIEPTPHIYCTLINGASTYEIMVRMFCNEGKMDMAMSIWEEMKDEGILPGMHMFATLINGLCREKKLQDACKYFEEMLDMGIRPPTHMFNKVKQAFVHEGKEDVLMMLTRRLEKLKTLLVVS